jgi:hypothetical protein
VLKFISDAKFVRSGLSSITIGVICTVIAVLELTTSSSIYIRTHGAVCRVGDLLNFKNEELEIDMYCNESGNISNFKLRNVAAVHEVLTKKPIM